jgi:uncharacterized membrane protein (DUF4010 family)
MARRANTENQPYLFSGATLIASGMMYLRLAILLSLFNAELRDILAAPFLILGGIAISFGWYWADRTESDAPAVLPQTMPKNPLELSSAFVFALLFLGMLILTHLAVTYLGNAGVFTLAAIMGVSDVDPFIMGMTQEAGKQTPVAVAAAGIIVAAASNNVVKGFYAYSMAPRQTGIRSLFLLIGLAALGLVPLLW